PATGEITYGLERLAMYLQGVESVYDLVWTRAADGTTIYYRDVFHQNEVEQSAYNFEHASTEMLFAHFSDYEAEAKRMIEVPLALPAYEATLKAAHTFNMLDARGAISVTERAAYIGRIRNLSRSVAQAYFDSREKLGFPMLANRSVLEVAECPRSRKPVPCWSNCLPKSCRPRRCNGSAKPLPTACAPRYSSRTCWPKPARCARWRHRGAWPPSS